MQQEKRQNRTKTFIKHLSVKSSMSGSGNFDREKFYTEVYNIVQHIPNGKVLTYGVIARLAGFPQYARLAGQALAHAPVILHLPCHRVVNSEGRTVAHWPEQQKLLESEGVIFKPNGCVNLKKSCWVLF